jgi:ribonuclease J
MAALGDGLLVRIHRGARDIGGNVVELEAAGQRLVLDFGRPLALGPEDWMPLPAIEGLGEGDASVVGVVLTHAHPDHYGLVNALDTRVPIYAGQATARILSEAAFFTGAGAGVQLADVLADRRSLQIGPFTVTPFLVDHSAFDAYSLLVEAGQRRVLYTGDLRFHGRKASLVERLISEPPANVHVVLMEGTHVGQDRRPPLSERDVEDRALEFFRATQGLVLVLYSPQNVDRLVSLFRAAKRARRTFVYDLYQAAVARATGRTETIPQPEWPDVRVYVPNAQRIKVRQSQEFERVNSIRAARIFLAEISRRRSELVLLFRPSMAAEIERAGCLEGAGALWSQWEGYLKEPSGQRLLGWLTLHEIPLERAHASGHATVDDLRRLGAAFREARLVPIHTAHPERFAGEIGRAELHADGEWWSV